MPSEVEIDDFEGGPKQTVKDTPTCFSCPKPAPAATLKPLLWSTQLFPLGPEADAAVEEVKKATPDVIVIDFTHPTAVNPNAEFYAKHKLPYIMGTTGGDRDALRKVDRARSRPQGLGWGPCSGPSRQSVDPGEINRAWCDGLVAGDGRGRNLCGDRTQHVQADCGIPGHDAAHGGEFPGGI